MIGLSERSQDAGAATKANLKASAGRVTAFRVTNANAAIRYFQLHNKATAPAGADVPVLWFLLPAGTAAVPSVTTISSDLLGETGVLLATGVGWAISTTATSFTDSATAAEHATTIIWN
jgi:hypothetical protein